MRAPARAAATAALATATALGAAATAGAATAPALLKATVPAKGAITFRTAAGAPVTSLRAGTYRVVVNDQSTSTGFAIDGSGVHRRTTAAGRGVTTWTVVLGKGAYVWSSIAAGGSGTPFTVTAAPVASAPAATTAAAKAKVDANTASVSELATALAANGVANANRWAREVEEYRPYPTDDPSFALLKQQLSKYNPSAETLAAIIASLTL